MNKNTDSNVNKDIGKTILDRTGKIQGTITNMICRWCGGCQGNRMVYSVKWDNGRRTYPCPAGCKDNPDGTIQII